MCILLFSGIAFLLAVADSDQNLFALHVQSCADSRTAVLITILSVSSPTMPAAPFPARLGLPCPAVLQALGGAGPGRDRAQPETMTTQPGRDQRGNHLNPVFLPKSPRRHPLHHLLWHGLAVSATRAVLQAGRRPQQQLSFERSKPLALSPPIAAGTTICSCPVLLACLPGPASQPVSSSSRRSLPTPPLVC